MEKAYSEKMEPKYAGFLLLESYKTGEQKRQRKIKSVFNNEFFVVMVPYTVIPRLTKIIRSGITFVSRNFSLSRT